jgi:tRNA pseudouridine38-40 synthase
MPRLALVLEYCGTEFHGWQKQKDLPSVQETLEVAITQLVQHPVTVVAAGRTDRGVHALAMVAHFDTSANHAERSFILGINHFLPPSIRVHAAHYVQASFHARFSANFRRYQYRILNRNTNAPLLHERVFWHPIPLDIKKMQEAANFLVGTHDFTSFRGKDCQAKTPIKTIHFCKISRQEDIITIDIQADGFLQHMVRNITGVLLKVGEGRQDITWVNTVLAAKTRTAAAMNVPACGLYFKEVGYTHGISSHWNFNK